MRCVLFAAVVCATNLAAADEKTTTTVVADAADSKQSVVDRASALAVESTLRSRLGVSDNALVARAQRHARRYAKSYSIRSRKQVETRVVYRIEITLDLDKLREDFASDSGGSLPSVIGIYVTVADPGEGGIVVSTAEIEAAVTSVLSTRGIEAKPLGQLGRVGTGTKIADEVLGRGMQRAGVDAALVVTVGKPQVRKVRGTPLKGAVVATTVEMRRRGYSQGQTAAEQLGGFGATLGVAATMAAQAGMRAAVTTLVPQQVTAKAVVQSGDIVIDAGMRWHGVREVLAGRAGLKVSLVGIQKGGVVLRPLAPANDSEVRRVFSRFSAQVSSVDGVRFVKSSN